MKNSTFKVCFLAFSLIASVAFAQEKGNLQQKLFNQDITPANQESLEQTGYIHCGTVEYEKYLQETYPNRMTNEEFENWLAPKIEEVKSQRLLSPNATYTIPVIFHIFTDGAGAENLSEAAIQAQIDQLNLDYANLAGSSFPQAADTDVEFCLAQQNELGFQLDEIGINRVTAYGDGPFSQTDFETNLKAATQWDPTKYFNIWVADLTGGLLGYAQFPDGSGLNGLNPVGGSADTDGVVILYSSVGSVANPNPNGGVYASGRTLTHEAGHWLGLRHIWGDTSSCTNDDYCADTPDATGSNFGCPTGVDSCPSDGLGRDMVENYMDYTDDTCMDTFTADQTTRIQTVMMVSPRRVELNTSNVCQPAQIFDLDGSIQIDNLNFVECGTTITPNVEITNRGNFTLTSATINYYLDTDTPTSQAWSGSLFINQSEIVALPTINIGPGQHTFTVELVSPNGGVDEQSGNNVETTNAFSGYFETTTINLNLIPDDYGSETTWQFADSGGTVLYSGGPYTNNNSTPINETFNVVVGECYTFTINDSFGDGICCSYGIGSYELTTDDNTVIFSGGEFASVEETTIGVNVLSSDEFFLDNSVSIYPNPVDDKLTIKLSNSNLPDGYKVYNVLGQIIKEQEISNISDLEINTSELSEGMYFVKLSKGNSAKTLPFIKK